VHHVAENRCPRLRRNGAGNPDVWLPQTATVSRLGCSEAGRVASPPRHPSLPRPVGRRVVACYPFSGFLWSVRGLARWVLHRNLDRLRPAACGTVPPDSLAAPPLCEPGAFFRVATSGPPAESCSLRGSHKPGLVVALDPDHLAAAKPDGSQKSTGALRFTRLHAAPCSIPRPGLSPSLARGHHFRAG